MKKPETCPTDGNLNSTFTVMFMSPNPRFHPTFSCDRSRQGTLRSTFSSEAREMFRLADCLLPWSNEGVGNPLSISVVSALLFSCLLPSSSFRSWQHQHAVRASVSVGFSYRDGNQDRLGQSPRGGGEGGEEGEESQIKENSFIKEEGWRDRENRIKREIIVRGGGGGGVRIWHRRNNSFQFF